MSFADKLSILRIILIPVFVAFLVYSKRYEHLRYVAVCVFIVAVLTDFFDGLVARIKKEKSEIGKVLDPLADKLLLLTAFVSLRLLGFNIPIWVVIIVVSRDIIILLGIAILHFLKVEIPITPSLWGKLTTFSQILTILMVMLNSFLPRELLEIVWSLAVLCTLISGIGYISRGISSLSLTDKK
jgi:cardiolipin synthase